MTVLCHNGGEEIVTPPEPQCGPDEDPPDLGCLDHAYFAAETLRLIHRARNIQHNLTAAAYGCGRRGTPATDDITAAIAQVIESLREMHQDMTQEIPFHAEEVLQELYAFESIVSAAQEGSLFESFEVGSGSGTVGGMGVHGQRSPSEVSQRYGAADAAGYDSSGSDAEGLDWSDDDDDPVAWHTEQLGRLALRSRSGVGAPALGRRGDGTRGGKGPAATPIANHKRRRSRTDAASGGKAPPS